MRLRARWLFPLAAVLVFASCATSRGIINIAVDPGANPTEGKAVYIAQVTDSRVFTAAPPKPSMPSLMDGDLDNAAITSRAIARKRNSYGMAMGDILLPEGRSVSMVVEEAVTKALREKGFVVLPKDSPDIGSATPLKIDIKEFWSWMNPGFWTISLEFKALVGLSGEELFAEGDEASVEGHYLRHTGAGDTRAWTVVITGGVDSLIDALKSKLK